MFPNIKILNELLTRVLCDEKPKIKAEAACIFAHSRDNEDTVLVKARFLYKSGLALTIAICCVDEPQYFVKRWLNQISQLGAPSKNVLLIEKTSDLPLSTDTETDFLTSFVAQNGWRNVYLVSTPFHQLRAFISVVSALSRIEKSFNKDIKFYNIVGSFDTRDKKVIHSQSQNAPRERRELFADELDKINKYFKKGILLRSEKIVEYLNTRAL